MSVSRRDLLKASLALGSLAGAGVSQAQNATTAPAAARPRVALVLGGGSARGFAHVGVIKALEQNGIRPDMVVGTSAGSLVGAFYAAGYTPTQMEEVALRIRDAEVVDLVSGSKRGMISGEALQNLVNQYVQNRSLENMRIPFGAVATNLRTGEAVTFRNGNTGFAVRASCSIPGVFIPAKSGNTEYVDGGLISPLPVQQAREMGAQMVIAVDVSSSVLSNPNPHGMFELLTQSFDIMGNALTKLEGEKADVLIKVDTSRFPSTDFNSRAPIMMAGFTAGQRAAGAIREKIARGPRRRG